MEISGQPRARETDTRAKAHVQTESRQAHKSLRPFFRRSSTTEQETERLARKDIIEKEHHARRRSIHGRRGMVGNIASLALIGVGLVATSFVLPEAGSAAFPAGVLLVVISVVLFITYLSWDIEKKGKRYSREEKE